MNSQTWKTWHYALFFTNFRRFLRDEKWTEYQEQQFWTFKLVVCQFLRWYENLYLLCLQSLLPLLLPDTSEPRHTNSHPVTPSHTQSHPVTLSHIHTQNVHTHLHPVVKHSQRIILRLMEPIFTHIHHLQAFYTPTNPLNAFQLLRNLTKHTFGRFECSSQVIETRPISEPYQFDPFSRPPPLLGEPHHQMKILTTPPP